MTKTVWLTFLQRAGGCCEPVEGAEGPIPSEPEAPNLENQRVGVSRVCCVSA